MTVGFHNSIIRPGSTMAKWNEIPRDVWHLILQKVVTLITDHIPFCGVCRLWRSIGLEYRSNKFPPNIPGLMISGGPTAASRTRRFLAFPAGKDMNQLDHDLPVLSVPHENLCRGSHLGWLVIVEKDMTMYINNPISGARVSLPHATSLPWPRPGDNPMSTWYVNKAILSAPPATSSTSVDCFVLVFYGLFDMAYCKVGDVTWATIDGPKRWRYIDAIFYKEVFYIMDHYGRICIFNVNLPYHKVTELGISPPPVFDYVQKWYLVEFGGTLLQILRKVDISGDIVESDEDDELFDEFDYDNNYDSDVGYFFIQTTHFQVFKLDMTSGLEPKWIDVKNLDGGAVFIGLNQSFALSKSNSVGYKGDRIYYTDDYIGSHKLHIRSGHDIGVFNIEESIFEPLFSTHPESSKPPAVWITPMQN